jgi:formylglycine-generating enzyme required for sulfatase activity/CheY-like chemotaxis protein
MRILLVDDDTSVLQGLLGVLKSLPGHEIRAATSGEKALENAATLGGLDLLITDVVMDPMDGFTLREQMRARYPGLRTIFISGYDLTEYAAQLGEDPLLQKPVTPEALAEAVQRAAAPPAPVAVAAVAAPRAVAATPRAVPAAQPAAAAPQAVAAPRAVAQPAAAQPRAVSAQPKAAVAQPKATVAQPRAAVAAPQASPKPVATPKAVAAPAAPAQPRAVAAPSAVAAPRAVAASQSAAQGLPAAVPAAPAPVPPPASAPETSSGPSLIGHTIGGYQIVSQLGEGRWGTGYAAVQTAINRPVGLQVLDPARAQDEAKKQRFIADARSKAHVQHPAILSVYEAGSADGCIFYTHEYVDGQSLAEMAMAGRTIDEQTALKILRSIADGLLYLERNHTPHTLLDASDIYLSNDGHPRLANLATQIADQQPTVEAEIRALGRSVLAVLPPGPAISPGLRALLGRTQQGGQNGIHAWGPLLQGVKALEPKLVPIEAEKITAQDQAALAAVEKARAQQKRAFLINVASMISLILLAVWAVWFFLIKSNERFLNEQIRIPAGEFFFGEGESATTDEFWIDKYEVTYGEYAQFVAWIEKNPEAEHDFDHPNAPRRESNIPPNWHIFYGRAKAGKPVHSVPIDLNSPVMEVTWWNAYAYAKWRGRDLPTEKEWEKAARGTEGFAYPWGEKFDADKANTGADYNYAKPAEKGKVDGYNYWGPVDGVEEDKSPYGVIGMAGNVSEWTSSWTGGAGGKGTPVIKGGNFTRKEPTPVSARITDIEAGKYGEHIGFRTISRKAPKQ